MFDLNFLPDSELKAVKQSLAVLVIRNVLVWVLFVGLLAVILLVWSKFFLESSLADSQERAILVSGGNLTLADQIESINKILGQVEEVQKEFVPWSQVIMDVVGSIPNKSQVSDLYLSAEGKSFAVNGHSFTREDLLEVEAALEANKYLDDIESPISNILSPQNIAFQFSGTLNINPEIVEEN